ncbi:hypothetical protein KC929_00495 [Patescibacteria group bacterium]|nr:hypothetical protein [Patescibacteria group bacterium]
MNRKHHSHLVFGLLGLLVLIFIMVFGVRYLVARYGYQDVPGNEAEAYEDGRLTKNPFTTPVDQVVDRNGWKTFSSGTMTFSYPETLALRVFGSGKVTIAPNAHVFTSLSCGGIQDEQERADCQHPPMSPDVTIHLSDESTTAPPGSVTMIEGTSWYLDRYQDEYGGTTWYRRVVSSGTIEVSYRYRDTLGGVGFETLVSQYGDQYRLNARQQDDLVRSILGTISIN